tara:strand:- start:543 stop:1376 length:834 start_codon:yes stop_codon:yes gene_type:complete
MSNEVVLYEKKDSGVALVTLNRPDRLNAVTGELTARLKEKIDDACKDDAVKVIVLTGAGRGFSAGADMDGLSNISDSGSMEEGESKDSPEKRDYATNGLNEWEGTYSYFPSVPKPIIAAINGPAAGVGLIMSLYCDMRLASDKAVFSTAFSKRGLIAEWGVGWILPRIIGVAHTMDIMLTARKFDGKEAERIGLVNKCFSDDNFMEDVLAYAEDVAKNVSPRSVQIMKRQIYTALDEGIKANLESSLEEMLKSFDSEDFKEGVKHFVEKRAPNFTGK